MERGIPDKKKGPGGRGREGTARGDRGFVPDCLFAGNRGWIKASRFASRFSTPSSSLVSPDFDRDWPRFSRACEGLLDD